MSSSICHGASACRRTLPRWRLCGVGRQPPPNNPPPPRAVSEKKICPRTAPEQTCVGCRHVWPIGPSFPPFVEMSPSQIQSLRVHPDFLISFCTNRQPNESDGIIPIHRVGYHTGYAPKKLPPHRRTRAAPAQCLAQNLHLPPWDNQKGRRRVMTRVNRSGPASSRPAQQSPLRTPPARPIASRGRAQISGVVSPR